MASEISLDLLNAEHLASEIIERFGICEPEHIRVRDIAYALRATVIEEKISRAAASIVKVGDHATIRIPANEKPERQRFSIAHELGHLVMNHIESIQKACSAADMNSWYKNSQETQANFFASELILPEKLVEKRCDVAKVNFEPILQIAKDFRASLTASAIKFVRLCPEQCAVVFSSEGKVQWSYRSPDWWPFIQSGKNLDERTVAFDFFNNKQLEDEPIGIDGDAWVESEEVDLIVEHSISSPRHGFVLSILWIRPS